MHIAQSISRWTWKFDLAHLSLYSYYHHAPWASPASPIQICLPCSLQPIHSSLISLSTVLFPVGNPSYWWTSSHSCSFNFTIRYFHTKIIIQFLQNDFLLNLAVLLCWPILISLYENLFLHCLFYFILPPFTSHISINFSFFLIPYTTVTLPYIFS